ncbi:hypothetical protein ACFL2H_03370 [Planctomycetota bacterium]
MSTEPLTLQLFLQMPSQGIEIKRFDIFLVIAFSSAGYACAAIVSDASQPQIDFVADFSQGDRTGQTF